MSIYSDHKVGALSDEEFEDLCHRENMKDAYDQAMEFKDEDPEEEDEDECARTDE